MEKHVNPTSKETSDGWTIVFDYGFAYDIPRVQIIKSYGAIRIGAVAEFIRGADRDSEAYALYMSIGSEQDIKRLEGMFSSKVWDFSE